MSKKDFKVACIIWILVLILQSFIPAFRFKEIIIQPDLLLILVTFVALRFGGDIAVIFGLVNGLIQDFTTQESLLGIMALSKSTTAYGLHFVQHYKTIWKRDIKLLFIFLSFVIHNLIYYYFYLSSSFSIITSGFFVIIIQSIITFTFFLIFEKILFKSKLI